MKLRYHRSYSTIIKPVLPKQTQGMHKPAHLTSQWNSLTNNGSSPRKKEAWKTAVYFKLEIARRSISSPAGRDEPVCALRSP